MAATGKEYSKEIKALMLQIIDLVEKEKPRPLIPLYNVDDKLAEMLGIMKRCVTKLKKGMFEVQPPRCSLRSLSMSSSSNTMPMNRPIPNSPQKIGHVGRTKS